MKTDQNRKTARTTSVVPQNRTHLYTTYIHTCGCGEHGGRKAAPSYTDNIAHEKSLAANAAIAFFHQFDPPTATAQTRRHDRNGASYLPSATKRAAALLQAVFEAHKSAEPLTGALRVRLLWTFRAQVEAWRAKRPDLDNLAKLALDAATKAGCWHDDAQIAHLETAKFDGPMPGLAFEATIITEGE